jgi:hypothetical protein
MAITCAAIVTNLLVALAPSTKIDELYYHMLVPSRIISDGTLRFYRQPWEGAIWPDMLYQISATPAHAMGFPDATNVVSWGLSATLLWFAWRIIRPTKPAPWAALWTASFASGCTPLYGMVQGDLMQWETWQWRLLSLRSAVASGPLLVCRLRLMPPYYQFYCYLRQRPRSPCCRYLSSFFA